MATFAGYVRVSRVGDRAETLISPRLQEEAIRRWASVRGAEVRVLPHELDASGGDDSRPVLLEAIASIERGDLDGIVVWKADRFTRSLRSSLEMLERVESAGGLFRSATEEIDPATPQGRMWRNMVFSMAQMEREVKAEGFERSKADAIARGVYIGRAPLGYRKREDRRLEPDPANALAVRLAFLERAAGRSWVEVAQLVGDQMGRPMLPASIRAIVTNPAYLGEARQGRHRNPDAHEPIVDRALWEAAQLHQARPVRGGHPPALLGGLVRCAGCSRRMTSTVGAKGRVYRCRRHHAGGRCPEPAGINERIEPYVENAVLAHLEGMVSGVVRDDLVATAEGELAGAEAELVGYQEATKVTALGAEHFVKGMQSRVDAVDAARRGLGEARRDAEPGFDPVEVAELWADLDVEERRHVLRSAVDVVWVGKGRGELPRRVAIIAKGFGPPGLSQRGVPAGLPVSLSLEGDLEGEIRPAGPKDLG